MSSGEIPHYCKNEECYDQKKKKKKKAVAFETQLDNFHIHLHKYHLCEVK